MENEETPDFINDFSPLSESVKQREYTKPNLSYGDVDATPIDEPVFTPPSFEELESQFSQQSNAEQPSQEPMGSANPYMEQLDTKDQKNASKALVEAALDAYSQLNKFANRLVKFNPQQIQAKMQSGEIDSSLTLPVNGQEMGVLDYVNAYNEEVGDVISVDDEFKDKVRPVMLRVFMKRNIGMTDEQYLAYLFGVDILTKGALVYSLKKQNQDLINSMIEISQNNAPAPQPKRSAAPTPDPDEVPIKRSAVKSEREYTEPEESVEIVEPEVQVVDVSAPTQKDDVKRGRKAQKAPQFGDSSILSQMEEIANGGKRRGRPRKK